MTRNRSRSELKCDPRVSRLPRCAILLFGSADELLEFLDRMRWDLARSLYIECSENMLESHRKVSHTRISIYLAPTGGNNETKPFGALHRTVNASSCVLGGLLETQYGADCPESAMPGGALSEEFFQAGDDVYRRVVKGWFHCAHICSMLPSDLERRQFRPVTD